MYIHHFSYSINLYRNYYYIYIYIYRYIYSYCHFHFWVSNHSFFHSCYKETSYSSHTLLITSLSNKTQKTQPLGQTPPLFSRYPRGSATKAKLVSVPSDPCWPPRLTGEQAGGEDDVPDPALAVDLRVEAAGDVARHAAGQGVQHDGGGVDGAVAVHVEHPQQRHDNNRYGDKRTQTETHTPHTIYFSRWIAIILDSLGLS